jgi:hypothetical protein
MEFRSVRRNDAAGPKSTVGPEFSLFLRIFQEKGCQVRAEIIPFAASA